MDRESKIVNKRQARNGLPFIAPKLTPFDIFNTIFIYLTAIEITRYCVNI